MFSNQNIEDRLFMFEFFFLLGHNFRNRIFSDDDFQNVPANTLPESLVPIKGKIKEKPPFRLFQVELSFPSPQHFEIQNSIFFCATKFFSATQHIKKKKYRKENSPKNTANARCN